MATYSPRSELKSFEDGIHLEPNVCVLNIAGTLLMVLNCNSQIRFYSKRKDIYVKKSSCFFKQEKNKTEILKKMLIVCIMLKAKKGAK